MENRKRLAVVVIHGIGEQKPMDTLRDFAKNIKSYLEEIDPTEKTSVLRSKPDSVSALYETRRLSLSSTKNRPITDFYEFYWAQNFRDTSFVHTAKWLRHLLFFKPWKLPGQLMKIWWTIWSLFLILSIAAFFLAKQFGDFIALLSALATAPILFAVLSFVESFTKRLFLTTAGDAARYFTPVPDNISERNNIRMQGIEFLKKLHGQVDKKEYDRIIVVGHSLGSAIAYDLLKLLWFEYNETPEKDITTDNAKLKTWHESLKKMNSFAIKSSKNEALDIDQFQACQHELFNNYRDAGSSWKISDFITIGAAISNAKFFYVNEEEFEDLIKMREIPVCPPVLDDNKDTIAYEHRFEQTPGNWRTKYYLHHAALFALTRWTNIYFTTDFVGGSAKNYFKNGVKDIPLKRKSIWFFLPVGHTKYWDSHSKNALRQIANALQLKN